MATNLPSSETSSDNTVRQYFNGYFDQPLTIDPAVYEQVYSFFYDKTGMEDAASALAQTVIAMTYNNKLDPLNVIKDFSKAANVSQMKQLLISVFNSLRSPTSKLGYGNSQTENPWITRNILP